MCETTTQQHRQLRIPPYSDPWASVTLADLLSAFTLPKTHDERVSCFPCVMCTNLLRTMAPACSASVYAPCSLRAWR
ncbi:hypothetical protein KCV03_g387, partial [Aureobasidium melanogenum]